MEPDTQPTQSGERMLTSGAGAWSVLSRIRCTSGLRLWPRVKWCARKSAEEQTGTVHGTASPCDRRSAEGQYSEKSQWKEYETGLEDRLKDLHGRVHRGAYRALPSKRVYIPKANGKQRPLGIAALEDKIVQSAVVTVLNQIYEEDFRNFSYGFRPGRSQHQALDALYVGIKRKKVDWILDMDLKGFFDNLGKELLMEMVERRIADPRILRLILKWLNAGIVEDGKWFETETGTPQGAVISPLLANIYLHYVLDQWTDQWRQDAQGDVIVVRYADDCAPRAQRAEEGPMCVTA